ncbi:MAG: nucleotide exchange factor GrpE [bacterium]|nr:nucleotide exchange factor GrpE [bacterium]
MTAKKVKKEEGQDETELVIGEEFAEELGHDKKSKQLREKLKECQAEKMEYLTGWQRAKADYANQASEHLKALEATKRRAKIGIIEDMLPTLDSFQMAVQGGGWEHVDETWRSGVMHIYRQLVSALEDNGIIELDPLNEEFDPARHQAVETRIVDDASQANKVIAVLQKGYVLEDQLVRPARVVVGAIS